MDKESWIILGFAVAILLITLAAWVGFSHFEARTYTRLTGHEVTTTEAMFVELRVMEPLKRQKGTGDH